MKDRRAPEHFDWTDTEFLEDRTRYRNLDMHHLWPGIGRLVQAVRGLIGSLDGCQRALADSDPDCPPPCRSFRESDIRGSALERVFRLRYPGWGHGTEEEIRKTLMLLEEREFFTDGFFALDWYDDSVLNDAMDRLKKAVLIAEAMDDRYEMFLVGGNYLEKPM